MSLVNTGICCYKHVPSKKRAHNAHHLAFYPRHPAPSRPAGAGTAVACACGHPEPDLGQSGSETSDCEFAAMTDTSGNDTYSKVSESCVRMEKLRRVQICQDSVSHGCAIVLRSAECTFTISFKRTSMNDKHRRDKEFRSTSHLQPATVA